MYLHVSTVKQSLVVMLQTGGLHIFNKSELPSNVSFGSPLTAEQLIEVVLTRFSNTAPSWADVGRKTQALRAPGSTIRMHALES